MTKINKLFKFTTVLWLALMAQAEASTCGDGQFDELPIIRANESWNGDTKGSYQLYYLNDVESGDKTYYFQVENAGKVQFSLVGPHNNPIAHSGVVLFKKRDDGSFYKVFYVYASSNQPLRYISNLQPGDYCAVATTFISTSNNFNAFRFFIYDEDGRVFIEGDAAEHQTLIARVMDRHGTNNNSITYQWQRKGIDRVLRSANSSAKL